MLRDPTFGPKWSRNVEFDGDVELDLGLDDLNVRASYDARATIEPGAYAIDGLTVGIVLDDDTSDSTIKLAAEAAKELFVRDGSRPGEFVSLHEVALRRSRKAAELQAEAWEPEE